MSGNQLVQYQESLVKELNPFEETSLSLLAKAEQQEVTNELQLASAVAVKKQITTHRKLVSDTRLEITRRFDEVKRVIMNRENEILLPLDKAQTALGDKILTYQEQQERIRREEAERVAKIVARVTVGDVYRYKIVDDVQDEGERLKKVYGELKPDDQKQPEVKVAFTQSCNKLADRRSYLQEQAVQEAERQRLAAEAAKQSEERAAIERDKAANAAKERRIQDEKDRLEREKQRKADEDAAEVARKKQEADDRNRVKTGVRTVTSFEITDPDLVPRDLCVPSDTLIRAAIKENREVPGVKVTVTKKV